MDTIANVATWILGGLLSVIGWFVAGNMKRVVDLETALNDHKVKIAETYVSRQTLQDMLAPIMDELRKIDRTQERLFEALGEKADK